MHITLNSSVAIRKNWQYFSGNFSTCVSVVPVPILMIFRSSFFHLSHVLTLPERSSPLLN